MRMDALIGDLVKKIDDQNRPTPDNFGHMTELLEQLQLIDVTLRGSKYDSKSGIVHRLEIIEDNMKKVLKRLKDANELDIYIDGRINEIMQQRETKQMNKLTWILGTIATIVTIVNTVGPYLLNH